MKLFTSSLLQPTPSAHYPAASCSSEAARASHNQIPRRLAPDEPQLPGPLRSGWFRPTMISWSREGFRKSASFVIGHFPFLIFHFSKPVRAGDPNSCLRKMENEKWKMTNDK